MPHPPLAHLALAREAVDRDDISRRRPDLFDELLAEPATRVLALWNGRTLISADGRALEAPDAGGWSDAASSVPPVVDLLPADRVTAALLRVYLGRTSVAQDDEPAGIAVIAQVLTDAAARELEPDEARWRDLRSTGGLLSDRDAGLFTEALAIANWHASFGHCPVCGEPTVVERGGWVRRCLAEDRELFPRTDPAVIVAVVDDDDRLLLGSNAAWGGSRWSLLAGFVEPGESFEQAVERELGEEAGVRVVDPEYLGSQPWPFPASVMIGFRARLHPGQHPDETVPDGEEILAVRWFGRDELWEKRDEIGLPGGSSIARAIIEDWYGGPLAEAPPVRNAPWGAHDPVGARA